MGKLGSGVLTKTVTRDEDQILTCHVKTDNTWLYNYKTVILDVYSKYTTMIVDVYCKYTTMILDVFSKYTIMILDVFSKFYSTMILYSITRHATRY